MQRLRPLRSLALSCKYSRSLLWCLWLLWSASLLGRSLHPLQAPQYPKVHGGSNAERLLSSCTLVLTKTHPPALFTGPQLTLSSTQMRSLLSLMGRLRPRVRLGQLVLANLFCLSLPLPGFSVPHSSWAPFCFSRALVPKDPWDKGETMGDEVEFYCSWMSQDISLWSFGKNL